MFQAASFPDYKAIYWHELSVFSKLYFPLLNTFNTVDCINSVVRAILNMYYSTKILCTCKHLQIVKINYTYSTVFKHLNDFFFVNSLCIILFLKLSPVHCLTQHTLKLHNTTQVSSTQAKAKDYSKVMTCRENGFDPGI